MRKLKLIAALGWTLTILISCLVSAKNISTLHLPFLGYDKVVHAAIYFVLVIIWVLYFQTIKPITTKIYSRIAFAAFSYGVLIEILQGVLTADRSADFFDVIANTIGIIIATMFFITIKKLKKI